MKCFALVFAAAVLVACAQNEPELTDDWAEDAGCEDGKCDGENTVPRVSSPDLLINDLSTLGRLEASGHGVGDVFGGSGANNATLVAAPHFASLVTVIDADLREFKAKDRKAGVGLNFEHRQFDGAWLRSSNAAFRLVAIVNRLDLVHQTPGACGEVRFVYRLQYKTAQGTSRLPMTLNVVYDQPQTGGSCADTANAWRMASGQLPLLTSMLANYQTPDRIEINLQAVRWPAVARGDMGGYAEYLLRVFAVNAYALTPLPLPNTIKADLTAVQKSSLQTWIINNAAAIDRGVAMIPAEFLATRAISVSPRGLARGANRPFLAAFAEPEQTFARINYAALQLIKSPGGLLRKLDTMTCQGCHQSRGLAGFHILGEEDADTFRSNAIEVGSSPQINDELPWRRAALADIAAGQAIAAPRPYAEHTNDTVGKYGAHCDLGGDPSFASWTCAAGYTCKDLSGEEIGMCVTAAEPGAGDSCETSTVSFDSNSLKDAVSNFETQRCAVMPTGRRAYCNHSGTKPFTASAFGGFPNGSCSSPCATMGKYKDDAICGAQPPNGFNDCLASGKPFASCLANATPEFRRRCDAKTPCGDDYVCAGVANAPRGVGACMPPYFIFQVRVDGHSVR